MGFKSKKLVGYVRRDRIARVKAYVEKYGPSVAKVPLDDKGRTALHLACRHASVYSFAHLLRLAPNLMKTDSEGNLPLHWALSAAKKGHQNAYTDIVLPLLKLCNGAQDVPNKSGLTPRQILTDLGLAEENSCDTRKKGSYDDDNDDDVDVNSIENDHDWNDRLRQEFEDDCGDSWGRYGHDNYNINNNNNNNNDYDDDAWSEPETYADWTDRMFSEYRAKHVNGPSTFHHHKDNARGHDGNRKSSWSKDDQRNFENECQRQQDTGRRLSELNETLTRTKQKSQFNVKHARLFRDADSFIRMHDLPWSQISSTTGDEFIAVLFVDVDPSDLAAKKKCLREQQVQWHPDKFLQKFGSRVAEEDREAVMSSVNHFAQIINAALDDLAARAQNNN